MATLLRPGQAVDGWKCTSFVAVWFMGGDWTWLKVMSEGASRLGLDVDCGLNARGYMVRPGLVDVEAVKFKVPCGTWMAEERPETRSIGQ